MNGELILSVGMKVVPVVFGVLATIGVMSKEQADTAIPIFNDLLTSVYGLITAASLIIGVFRSKKAHPSKK
jgi:hypothetical protein